MPRKNPREISESKVIIECASHRDEHLYGLTSWFGVTEWQSGSALTRPSSSPDTTARLALISRTAATVTTPARKMRPTADRTILARDGGRALGPLAPVAGESTGGDVRPLAIDTPYRGGPRSSRSSQATSIATGAAGGRGVKLTLLL